MKKTKMFLLLIAMLFAVAFTACGGGGGGRWRRGRHLEVAAVDGGKHHWRLGSIHMGQCNMGTVEKQYQSNSVSSKNSDTKVPLSLDGRG